MRIEQLKSSLSGGVAPVYLIEGEDSYFCDLAVKTIQNKCITSPELNLSVYSGADVIKNQSEITFSLMQYPFMSEKRMVIVRDFLPQARDLKGGELDKYLNAPSDTGVLLIVNTETNDVLKKYEKVTVVDCKKADMAVLIKYIQVTLKRENLIITTKNAQMLAEFCKMEMTRISGEVEKLCAYCYGNAEVTEEDIVTLVSKETDYQIYEMTENVAKRRYDKAYEILADMQSKSNDTQRIFSALYYYFRRLFFCAVSKKSAAQLAKDFGVKEYAIVKSTEQAKKFTPKKLKEIVDMFTFYDENFKCGNISIDAALTLSVGKIME